MCLVEAASDASSPWAADLLAFLRHRDGKKSPQNLFLLALVAEFMQSSSKYVHFSETSKKAEHHIARTASQVHRWDKELSYLFDVEDADGNPRS